jgi:hypothetical protein
MLADIEGVRGFLGLSDSVEPRGRKGKAKMKGQYRAVGMTQPYKSGERAHRPIGSLSFGPVPKPVGDHYAATASRPGE